MILQLLGASGAGKSTLAKALSQKTGLPHLQSDHYLWPDEKFDIPRPVEERRRMLEEDLRQFLSFILDGDVTRWFPAPPFTPDLLVLLRCPEKERMERLRQRETPALWSVGSPPTPSPPADPGVSGMGRLL